MFLNSRPLKRSIYAMWTPHTHKHTLMTCVIAFHILVHSWPFTILYVQQSQVLRTLENHLSATIAMGQQWGATWAKSYAKCQYIYLRRTTHLVLIRKSFGPEWPYFLTSLSYVIGFASQHTLWVPAKVHMRTIRTYIESNTHRTPFGQRPLQRGEREPNTGWVEDQITSVCFGAAPQWFRTYPDTHHVRMCCPHMTFWLCIYI